MFLQSISRAGIGVHHSRASLHYEPKGQMRVLNRILQMVVTLIFLIFIALGVLLIGAAVFGMQDLGVAKMLGVSVFVFVFGFISMLFFFGLLSTLLEIAENTRVLRDAVQSGSLKVMVVNDEKPVVETQLQGNDLTLEEALQSIKG